MPIAAAFRRTSKVSLDAYRPRAEWFMQGPAGLHGLGHAGRVLVWANALGYRLGARGEAVDADVLRWAAVLHDIRRCGEGVDPQHGDRAAAWFLESRPGLAAAIDLTPRQRGRVARLLKDHVRENTSDRDTSIELICLQDADALDRVRIDALDYRYLRTPDAVSMIPAARTLFEGSRPSESHSDEWFEVRRHALGNGLWSRTPDLSAITSESARSICWGC
jgi:HD domain